MKPMKFKQSNRVLLKPESMSEKDCGTLYVYTDGKQCISCWGLSLKERLGILLHGKVWVMLLSGSTQPPLSVSCERTVFTSCGGEHHAD
jgi:hypothetical protein